MRKNLSSGLPTMKDSNQTAHLQRLARILKLNYYTLQIANNRGDDQTAGMRSLICSFVPLRNGLEPF